MITADHHRAHERAGELANFCFDSCAHRLAIERREDHVAAIGAAQAREHIDLVDRMERLHERGDAAHVIRREARPRLVRRARVGGNAEDRAVRVRDGVRAVGQPKERNLPVTEIVERWSLHRSTSFDREGERSRRGSARPSLRETRRCVDASVRRT